MQCEHEWAVLFQGLTSILETTVSVSDDVSDGEREMWFSESILEVGLVLIHAVHCDLNEVCSFGS